MYDRTVGALVPIGRALTNWLFESQASTNEIIVKIWDTHTHRQIHEGVCRVAPQLKMEKLVFLVWGCVKGSVHSELKIYWLMSDKI